MTPYETGALALGAINTANSLFSKGKSTKWHMNFLNKQNNINYQHWRNNYAWEKDQQIDYLRRAPAAQVEGAKAAGLHPLFAMGGAMPGSGTPGGAQIAGQSDTGSNRTDALLGFAEVLLNINSKNAQKDIAQSQALRSAMRVIDNKMNNDNLASQRLQEAEAQRSQIHPHLQEFKPGEVDAHRPGDRSQNMNEKSLWTKAFANWLEPGEHIMMLGEDIGEAADSLAIATAMWNHPHNNPIFKRIAKRMGLSIAHKMDLRPFFRKLYYKALAEQSKRHNRGKDRHPDRYPLTIKVPKKRQTTPDIFFNYSRGPHR
jgi:hypothetical protein